jgi:hypothetical protein
MMSRTLQTRASAPMTTDGSERGSSEMSLTSLLEQFADDATGASWTLLLRAELEDAFDVALLRASLAETPTLSDHKVFAAR